MSRKKAIGVLALVFMNLLPLAVALDLMIHAKQVVSVGPSLVLVFDLCLLFVVLAYTVADILKGKG